MSPNRREFLKQSVTTGAALGLSGTDAFALVPEKQETISDGFPVKWWEMEPIPFTIPDDYHPDGFVLADHCIERKYLDAIRKFIYIYDQFRNNGNLETLDNAYLTVKSKHESEIHPYTDCKLTSEDFMKQLMNTGCIFNTWAHAFEKPQQTDEFTIRLYPQHRPSNIELECILCVEILREYAFMIHEEYRHLVDLDFGLYAVNPDKQKFYSPIHLPSSLIPYPAYAYYQKYHAIPPYEIAEKWCEYCDYSSGSDIDEFLEQFDKEYMEKLKNA